MIYKIIENCIFIEGSFFNDFDFLDSILEAVLVAVLTTFFGVDFTAAFAITFFSSMIHIKYSIFDLVFFLNVI